MPIKKKTSVKASLIGDGKNYPKTAVTWSWRDDNNKWVAFDQKSCEKFEWEYDSGNRSIPVDDQRFLDLTPSHKDILKNFTKSSIDEDEPLVGLQRRFDDETKRRAIKRDVPTFLDTETVLLLAKKNKYVLSSTLELYGATVLTTKLTKKVTIVVVAEGDEDKFQEKITEAQTSKVFVVTSKWIDECVSQASKVPTTKFEIKAPEKRKAEAEQPIKKAKTEAIQTNLIRTATGFIGCAAVKAGTMWNGACTSVADNTPYPIILTVTERSSETAASGTIQWPTLSNAQTKFKATISGDTLSLHEYEAISGEDEVDLPNDYSINVNGSAMTGKLITDDPADASNLALTKLPTPASTKYDAIKTGAVIKGTVSYEFQFKITSRTGGDIKGAITWPTLNNAQTLVKGTIEGEEFTFQEYESKSDDVTVPVDYLGHAANNTVTGQFSGEGNHGQFQLNLQ